MGSILKGVIWGLFRGLLQGLLRGILRVWTKAHCHTMGTRFCELCDASEILLFRSFEALCGCHGVETAHEASKLFASSQIVLDMVVFQNRGTPI